MHAEATSEKVAMGRHLAGRATAVLGTHTHVQTNDASLWDGTAYLTDCGMTGPHDSVIGVRTEIALRRFLTQLPARSEPALGDVRLEGALIECDPATRARHANRDVPAAGVRRGAPRWRRAGLRAGGRARGRARRRVRGRAQRGDRARPAVAARFPLAPRAGRRPPARARAPRPGRAAARPAQRRAARAGEPGRVALDRRLDRAARAARG